MFFRSYPKTMASVLLKTTEHDLEGLIALGWFGVSVREISPPMVGPEDAGAGVDNFAEHVDRFGMRMVSFSFRLPPSVDSDSHVFQSVFFHEQGLEHMPLFGTFSSACAFIKKRATLMGKSVSNRCACCSKRLRNTPRKVGMSST